MQNTNELSKNSAKSTLGIYINAETIDIDHQINGGKLVKPQYGGISLKKKKNDLNRKKPE